MPLDPELKKRLRGIGHALHPVVTVAGNGLSEGVLTELERALHDHELIKVKLRCPTARSASNSARRCARC